jgi:hypothetical protein
MLALFTLTIQALDPSDVSAAKDVLRQIQQIEGNLTIHLRELTRFAQGFRVLTENDKKVKARIKYLQNIGTIRDHMPRVVEVPLAGPTSGPPYVIAIPSGFSRYLPRSALEFSNSGQHPVKRIMFDSIDEPSCFVATFSISFVLQDGGSVELKPLAMSEIESGIDFPKHILFQKMIITPITNRGNATHHCFPGFRASGSR